jgi:RHS repeat-associated protein
LVETVNAAGGEVASYTQGRSIDEPLAMDRGGTIDYYEADGVSSITSLTATNGTVTQSYTYDSFGNTTNSSGSLTNFFRYTGREFDTETGLYYYRARYYDPSGGRFLSEDPSGFGGGINFYSYAAGTPTNLTDPFGLNYTTYRTVAGPGIFVEVSITLYGPGASDALAAAWRKAILNTWNKNPGFDKCAVIFEVQIVADPTAPDPKHAVAPSGSPGANNYIYVPLGSPADMGNPHINIGGSTGTIPSGTLSFSVAHEFGHLLNLYDSNIGGVYINPWRPNNDIMNEGDVISQYDINRIVKGGDASTCGCN